MSGSYLTSGGVEHAKTMLAYHRDAEKTARALVIVFGIVFGFEGWLWLSTNHGAFIFGVVLGLAAVLLGAWLHIHHGRKVAHWEATLDRWERVRRDRLVHARKLEGWEL